MEKKINIIDAGLSPETLEQLDLVGISGGSAEHTESASCIALISKCPTDFTLCVWVEPDCMILENISGN